jgi:heptosyltransferase-2
MRILIELPTWLGDTIMSTPAIENIVKHTDASLTLAGSFVAIESLKNHPRVEKTIVLNKSYGTLIKTGLSLQGYDYAISFRNSLRSHIFLHCVSAKYKHVYKKDKNITRHQVLRYNDFVNGIFHINEDVAPLSLYYQANTFDKPVLGINPGATYGSAKRWYPEKFAQVAEQLNEQYDILLFGGPGEVDVVNDIEQMIQKGNVTNLAGKTSIPELIKTIAGLDLFITNDSGPMHIAAAYSVKTVAIFGPTKSDETNQWKNENGVIIKKEMACAPCMKRTCPLKHHNCMKEISANDVLKAIDCTKSD